MRHRVSGRKLGRPTAHRQALISNLLASLFLHERIETTLAKAKELKPAADRMITLGKRGDLHARRQALAVIRNKDVVGKLFADLAPRNKDRNGGYTRVLKTGYRLGDSAPMSIIELVERPAAE